MNIFQVTLIFCCIQILVQAQTPPPIPKIPETFSTNVEITISDDSGVHHGSGKWGRNQPEGKGREYYVFDHTEYGYAIYERYDLGKQFDLSSTGNCTVHSLNGSTMPDVWAWVQQAQFVDTVGRGQAAVDVWEFRMGYATMRLGVHHYLANTPVYLIRQARDHTVTAYNFNGWNTTAPAEDEFDVPSTCPNSISVLHVGGSEACIDRSTTLSRAKVWVAKKVPYNQGATYEGYREDCSGYVSMTWESSKPGHVTSTFHEIAHAISKDDLKEGDCLLYAAEHVVYFGGWTNSEKTYYQAYEETKPGEGTVTRSTPYPYWYSQSSFKPYRYNNICA